MSRIFQIQIISLTSLSKQSLLNKLNSLRNCFVNSTYFDELECLNDYKYVCFVWRFFRLKVNLIKLYWWKFFNDSKIHWPIWASIIINDFVYSKVPSLGTTSTLPFPIVKVSPRILLKWAIQMQVLFFLSFFVIPQIPKSEVGLTHKFDFSICINNTLFYTYLC